VQAPPIIHPQPAPPPVPPPPPLPNLHRQLGPLYTFALGQRGGLPGAGQQQQQWPQLQFDPALLLAREYKSLMDRTRQQRLQEVQDQLSNGTAPGFRAVRLFYSRTCHNFLVA
jgi:hypothetical protein